MYPHLKTSPKPAGSTRALLLVLLASVVPVLLVATTPDWWQSGVLTSDTANDYAPVNQGQLKNMASAAMAEMDAKLPGGAGTDVSTLVSGWSNDRSAANDYGVANLGQLKAVAKPFYDRLIHFGIVSNYPWASVNGAPNDFAAANIGQLKNVFNFSIPSTGLLSPPQNFVTTTLNPGSVSFSWSNNPDVSFYQVYRSTDGTNFTLYHRIDDGATTYTDDSANPNVTYYYRLVAVSTQNALQNSTSSIITVPAVPHMPTSFVATAPQWDLVNLSWDAIPAQSPPVIGLQLICIQDGVPTPRPTVNLPIAATSFQDSGVDGGTGYTYQLVAINERGASDPATQSVSTPTEIPPTPQITSVVTEGTRELQINWTEEAGSATGFWVQRADIGEDSWTTVATVPVQANVSSYSQTDSGLYGGTTYNFRIFAFNADAQSLPSDTASGTTDAFPTDQPPDALGVVPNAQPSVATWDSTAYVPVQATQGFTIPGLWDVNGSNFPATPTYDGDLMFYDTGDGSILIWFSRPHQMLDESDNIVNTPPSVMDVYFLTTEGWQLQYVYQLPETGNSLVGSTIVAAKDGWLFVGAPAAQVTIGGQGSPIQTGAVYAFLVGWDDVDQTYAPFFAGAFGPQDGAAGDGFGASIAADGDRLIIGAPFHAVSSSTENVTWSEAGQVYLYDYQESEFSWTFNRTEISSFPQTNGDFGFSVALRARNFVVGAPGEAEYYLYEGIPLGLGGAGAIYIKNWDQAAGTLVMYNPAFIFNSVQQNPLNMLDTFFGYSVAIDGLMRLAIGTPYFSLDEAHQDCGLMFFMNWNGGLTAEDAVVSLPAPVIPADAGAGSFFGGSVRTTTYANNSDFTVGGAWDTSEGADNEPLPWFMIDALTVPYLPTPSTQVVGWLVGEDPDNDPLTFSLFNIGGTLNSFFNVTTDGVLTANADLSPLQSNGMDNFYAQKLLVSVSDDRGWTYSQYLSLDFLGAENPANGGGGDFLGGNPTGGAVWTASLAADPNGDADGDGIPNYKDADPTNPNINYALKISITYPPNNQNF